MKELSVSKSAGDSESGGVVRLLPGAWRGRAVRLLSLGGFLFLWQAVAWTGKFTPYQVPSPTLVASTFTGLLIDGDILYFLSHSLRHYSIGLAWGISVGIAVGLIMAWFRQA
ncbi:MAG: hypothetical protein HN400_01605, partial [Nitrospinaceae bacterium]|nr:hypothetical protein [Nitrospinaceae bacterium]